MELLEGLAPPARGAVRVLGCDPCRERALVRRRMGIMLQEGGFPPDLTVAETGRMWVGDTHLRPGRLPKRWAWSAAGTARGSR